MNLTKKKLEDIESLLSQSLNGLHLLFDNETVATVLQSPTELDIFSFENVERIQHLMSLLMEHSSIEGRRSFLDSLDQERYELLLRGYFHLVDNSLLASQKMNH